MTAASAPLFAGRYAILSELGRGGMGVVHCAEDTKLKRQVAVKRISSNPLESEGGDRFFTEARACAQVRSAHVVPIYDYGVLDDGEHYMVLELIEGRSLYAELKRGGRFSVERARHIGLQLCRGLGAAHEAGIIHRDLKPSNVMLVARDGDTDFVKILDFGVAKIIGEDLTTPGLVVGTLDYMAPEMVRGDPVDARADIYALGVLLYRLVTGTRLFREKSSVPGFHNAFTAPEPISKRALDVEIPPVFAAAVMKCLAKDPDGRFASMVELANALDGDVTLPQKTLDPVAATVPASSLSNPAQSLSSNVFFDSSQAGVAGAARTAELSVDDSSPLSTPLTGFPTAANGMRERGSPSRLPAAVGAAVALLLFTVLGTYFFFIDATPSTIANTPVAAAPVESVPTETGAPAPTSPAPTSPAAISPAATPPPVVTASAPSAKTKPSKRAKASKRSRSRRRRSPAKVDEPTFKRVRTSPDATVFKRVRTKTTP